MESRRKFQMREQDANLDIKKKAARSLVAGYYGKQALTSAVNRVAPVFQASVKDPVHFAKNVARPKETRLLLKYLTKEQKKQWNSYSFKKQTQILEKANQQVIKKNRNPKSVPVHRKAFELQEKLEERAVGYRINKMTMADRWEVPVPKGDTPSKMKKSYQAGDMEHVTFYTDSIRRGTKKVKSIERKYQKEIKKEKRENQVLFIASFLSILDKEGKKANQIKQMKAEDQITHMEAENKTIGAMVGYAAAPAKVVIQAAVAKTVRRLAEKAGGLLLKLLAPVLLPIVFTILLLCSILSIIGGSPDSESGAVSIGAGGYSPTGAEIAEYALQWKGTPYVWGGTDLNVAVDCSGFTYSVYAHFGIVLPRTAMEQGNVEQGQYVKSLADAIPGDLIWWAPRHVGIYVGNGQAVQSSGDETNYDLAHAGPGVTTVSAEYRKIGTIRRFVTDATEIGGAGIGGNPIDPVTYTKEQLEVIWAVVAQEDCGSYEGSLAVISSAMNRTESSAWKRYGAGAYAQLTAPGQYCYSSSVGGDWQSRLNGNVPAYTKQAVNDCLVKGVRNHSFTSFRSTNGGVAGRVKIGGNWYFN